MRERKCHISLQRKGCWSQAAKEDLKYRVKGVNSASSLVRQICKQLIDTMLRKPLFIFGSFPKDMKHYLFNHIYTLELITSAIVLNIS